MIFKDLNLLIIGWVEKPRNLVGKNSSNRMVPFHNTHIKDNGRIRMRPGKRSQIIYVGMVKTLRP